MADLLATGRAHSSDELDRLRRRIDIYHRHDNLQRQRHVHRTLKQTKDQDHTALLRQKWQATRVKRQKIFAPTPAASTPAIAIGTSASSISKPTSSAYAGVTSQRVTIAPQLASGPMHSVNLQSTPAQQVNVPTGLSPMQQKTADTTRNNLQVRKGQAVRLGLQSLSPDHQITGTENIDQCLASGEPRPTSFKETELPRLESMNAVLPVRSVQTLQPTQYATGGAPLLPDKPSLSPSAGLVDSKPEFDQIGIADVDELQAILDTLENENKSREFSTFPEAPQSNPIEGTPIKPEISTYPVAPSIYNMPDNETQTNGAIKTATTNYKIEPNLNKAQFNSELFQQPIYQNYDQHYSQNKMPVTTYGTNKPQYTTQQSYPPQNFAHSYNTTPYQDISQHYPNAANRRYSTDQPYFNTTSASSHPLLTMQQMVNQPPRSARPSRRTKTTAAANYGTTPIQRSPNVTVGTIGGLGRTMPQWSTYPTPQQQLQQQQQQQPQQQYPYRYQNYPQSNNTSYYSAPPAVQKVSDFNLIEDIFPNNT